MSAKTHAKKSAQKFPGSLPRTRRPGFECLESRRLLSGSPEGTLIGTYRFNYRDNAAGCRPDDWPYPTPADGNPYYCSSPYPPGPYFVDAEPGQYRVVVTAEANVSSAHVWSGDASSGYRYNLEKPVGYVVDINHTHGQLVFYAWDWYVGDNSADSWIEVQLYGRSSDIAATSLKVNAEQGGVDCTYTSYWRGLDRRHYRRPLLVSHSGVLSGVGE